ncbi:MAG: EAL domain-containing protein [Oscillospiraceae bacterium]
MFIARQPIFNKSKKIYGYELLFRADREAKSFGGADSSAATAGVLGGLFENGIDAIAGGGKAFVNFDKTMLMSDAPELIAPDSLVIEVLETVTPDRALLERLALLRKRGYKIALDDFAESVTDFPIVPLADIIKYDIIATPLHTIGAEVKKALAQNKLLLAEKIETEAEFQRAQEMGFLLFQGYFFCKPNIVAGSESRGASKASYARILSELRKEEPSYQALAQMINADVNLAYRMMRMISRRSTEDTLGSLKKALLKLGFKELERYMHVLMLQEYAGNKPTEIMRLSLLRSRFSEFVSLNSTNFRSRRDEASMMCLFSMIDALLDQTMEQALNGIAMSDDIYNALVHGTGALKPVCHLVSAYEEGDWEGTVQAAAEVGIDPALLADGYMEAIQWADEIMKSFRG